MDSLELMTITLMMLRLSGLSNTNWFLIWLPFIISIIIRIFKWSYREYMGADSQVLITNLDWEDKKDDK